MIKYITSSHIIHILVIDYLIDPADIYIAHNKHNIIITIRNNYDTELYNLISERFKNHSTGTDEIIIRVGIEDKLKLSLCDYIYNLNCITGMSNISIHDIIIKIISNRLSTTFKRYKYLYKISIVLSSTGKYVVFIMGDTPNLLPINELQIVINQLNNSLYYNDIIIKYWSQKYYTYRKSRLISCINIYEVSNLTFKD